MHFSARFLALIAVVGLFAIPFAESRLPAARARTRSLTSTQQCIRRVDVRGLRKRDKTAKGKSGTGETPVNWMENSPGKNPNAGNGSSIGPGGENNSPFCVDLTSLVDLGKDPKFFKSTKFDGLSADEIFDKFSNMCYKYLDDVAPDYTLSKVTYFQAKPKRYPKIDVSVLSPRRGLADCSPTHCCHVSAKQEAGDAWPIPNLDQTYVGVCVAYRITSEEFWTSGKSDKEKAAYLQFFKTPAEMTLGVSRGRLVLTPLSNSNLLTILPRCLH